MGYIFYGKHCKGENKTKVVGDVSEGRRYPRQRGHNGTKWGALRPPSDDTLLMQFTMVFGESVYYGSNIITTFSLSTGEVLKGREDKDKEPEPTTWELAMFDWVRAWMEEGGSLMLEK